MCRIFSYEDRRNVSAELTTPARQPAGCRATPPLRGGEYSLLTRSSRWTRKMCPVVRGGARRRLLERELLSEERSKSLARAESRAASPEDSRCVVRLPPRV